MTDTHCLEFPMTPGHNGLARVVPVLVIGLVACTAPDGSSGVTASDSAGILIAESTAPAWAPGDGWSIRAEPDLVLGSAEGEGPAVFGAIADAEILPDGIAVIDGQAREVRVFGHDGDFRRSFGGEGDGPGEFRAPSVVRLTVDGELFVYDRQRHRVSWFRPSSGELLRSESLAGVRIGGSAPLGEVLPLSDGSLAGRDGSDLSAGRGEGVSRDTSYFAVLAFGSREARVVASLPGVFTIHIAYQGNPGARAQPLTPWPSWDVAADALYITSGEHFQIRKVSSSGLAAVFRRADRPSPVDERHVEAFLAETLDPIPPDQRAMVEPILDLLEYPERTPAYSKLLVDPLGFSWAERPGPAGRSPGPSWDVYSPAGEYLGPVATPEGAELVRIGRDKVLAVWRDELDVPYLHRYPLVRSK